MIFAGRAKTFNLLFIVTVAIKSIQLIQFLYTNLIRIPTHAISFNNYLTDSVDSFSLNYL